MSICGFPKFAEENSDKILDSIERCARRLPSKMKRRDYRFNISNYFLHHLFKPFNYGGEGGSLKPCYTEFVDFIYGDTSRISAKIQAEIFQRDKIRGEGLTVPKDIVMINSLKEEGCKEGYDFSSFDYLVAIQRGDTSDAVSGESITTTIGFGIISSQKLNGLIVQSNNDQVKVKIPNSQYDVLKTRIVNVMYNRNFDAGLNDTFSRRLAEMFDELGNSELPT